jgi:cell division protein FtsL
MADRNKKDAAPSNTPEIDYSRAVFGSEAYDPNWLFPEYEQPAQEPEEQPAAAPARRAKSKPRTGLRRMTDADAKSDTQGMPLFAALGTLAVAALAVLLLFGNIRLMQIERETKTLQRTLVQLEEQSARLDVAYAAAFDLNEVRAYATGTLGMREPRAEQIHYLDLERTDRAVIYETEQTADVKAISGIASLWQSLLAYFK